ncbi:MAG: ornithine--oxo-acid transaminase [Chloroflexi bacterium]|nr:ornithine--oxo-acid transaminase [Chloroflexota bacterium]MBK6711260.1 ornithine--oxo-acid transaminase [Chloroflexota bacterium]MBK7915859.1 ornithine--oxo-acid transaminase [Chloroflexota bacterium]MBK8931159.1 ornithine--oxo-acid transaminase [Chloroflexota bacterium]MBP6805504.1 ornithine--oxo-acid transaminase [Chloroflexota bacterium]
MDSNYFIELDETYSAHNYLPLDVVIERGEGVWVYDVDGRKYLDCLSAYSAVNQGHCHPKIRQAAIEQMGRITLTSRAFRNDQMGPFLQELCQITGYEMALPMNSGAEAVETAVKAARKWGYEIKNVPDGQAEIIVCRGNFHGRTTTTVGLSSEESYKRHFGPFTPGFVMIPYGDTAALEAAITPNTVGFLVEPIQGEGGVVMPPEGYLAAAANICARHNVLFIADEIQTGLGRTGQLFASQHEGVRPDITIVGKALSGGFYPVSAVLTDEDVLGLFQPGDHGSTFGGNPLGSAIGRAALLVIVEENLVERSRELGAYFKGRLERIESDVIQEVRGKGLFIGVELKVAARPFAEALRERGILCKETHKTVLRFAPPLVITQEEIDWAVGHIEAVLMTEKIAA